MLMMMMKKKGSLAVIALLLASVDCILQPTKEDLTQISLQGEKYLDKHIENAVSGVKEMKTVMKKSSENHQKLLDALEKTKEQKEGAMLAAREMEAKLEQEEEVCNETVRALWEECKPCLKNTCVKYYSRTCSSGSGLVGRQLEDVLNRTSPISIWIDGENTGVLQREAQRQSQHFRELEEKYVEMADGVDGMFADSMKVADHIHFSPPAFFLPSFLGPFSRRTRSLGSLFRSPFLDIHNWFSPVSDASFFSSMDAVMDLDLDTPPDEDGAVNEDVVITKPFGNGEMTCREIRRNSAGCLKFREACEKCRDIQHVDCAGKKPLEGPLKEALEEALASAERFTQRYSGLLKKFEEHVSNTSSILDVLDRRFGWVSSLANGTEDKLFQVQTVTFGETEQNPAGEEKPPADTSVSVQLFNSPTMSLSVPGDIPWTDPKFSEVVAQRALDRYKESSLVVK
ncbi:clusterin isoform X2 [Brachionichthys hirsutus]|uniref:clusterin isoform X2 n=1 Tax=Brachionichthys hirsutus TaxID=412623 RepID=UPI0036048DC3